MFNLIKMDLYRMFHSVSTWVILLLTVGVAVFCIAATNIDIELMAEDPQYAEKMLDETEEEEAAASQELQLGISAESDPHWIYGDIDAGDFLSIEIKSGIVTLLVVIFAAIFANAAQKNGYIKNVAGQLPDRGMLVLSQLAAMAVQILLMILIFAAVVVASGMIFWGDRVSFGSVSDILRLLGIQYLLNMGFAALILFLTILTKSSAFSMTAGILMILRVLTPVYSIINRAVGQISSSWKFDINSYVLEGNINMAGIDASAEILIRAVVVGAVFLILSTVFLKQHSVIVLILKKRDVR